MSARANFLVLLIFLAGLTGCAKQFDPKQNVILSADNQRLEVIERTRAASYSVFPDTDDPEKLMDPTFLDAMHAVSPNGSAFAVRADGLVVTNAHVIEGTNYCTGRANALPKSPEEMGREVGRYQEETARREGKKDTFCLFVTQSFSKVYRAKLVKIDASNDIAVMCLQGLDAKIPVLRLAEAGSFHDGAEVLTIGAPFGNMNMMTHGYVSNLVFYPEDPETGRKNAPKLQFSAPILPGNSGGPLVSVATGEVVGQVVSIYVAGGIPTGMSYANPVKYLQENTQRAPACTQ